MAEGPGKYDDLCREVLEKSKAGCAIVIVLDGERGNGFSVTSLSPDYVDSLPRMLEWMSRVIRQDLEAKKNPGFQS